MRIFDSLRVDEGIDPYGCVRIFTVKTKIGLFDSLPRARTAGSGH